MEFDELLVTTKVDALVRLVKEKGSIEIGMAAKLLDVEPENVEEWAHILEEEGLIKLNYHLTKAYISWVTPTPEQLEKEKSDLYREKGNLVQEVGVLKQQIEPQVKEIGELKADFEKMYGKVLPRIEKLQTQLAGFSSTKGKGMEKLVSGMEKLEILDKKALDVTDALSELKSELAETRKQLKDKTPVDAKFKEVDTLRKDLSDLGDRLKGVDEKIAVIQRSLPREKQDKDSLQKSLDPLKKDFADFKHSTSVMRENITSIKEAFEILGTVDKSITERAGKMQAMKSEMLSLLAALKELQAKGNKLAENVKSEINSLDGFSESMDFVKMALTRFPSQKEMMQKLDELSQVEKSLELKLIAAEKSNSSVVLPQISLDELTKLKAELDEKRKLLSQEVGELFSAVEQENATYATFQKIKDKAISSVESYSSSIQKLETELKTITVETKKTRTDIDTELEKMKGSVDDKDLKDLLTAAEEVEKKKALLDDVAESLDALSTAADNITKKLNLLSKEAELLSIKSEGSTGVTTAKVEEKENDLRQQLSLTKSEQQEFDKKREELKELIKKLWEQG